MGQGVAEWEKGVLTPGEWKCGDQGREVWEGIKDSGNYFCLLSLYFKATEGY